MAGPDQGNLGSTDWLNKASPDHLLTQGKAIFAKVAQMDQATQDRFVQEIRSVPNASRLFERLGAVTG